MLYYQQGLIHKQAHKAIPNHCYEEEQGRGGFYGPASHLLKKSPPTRWKHIEGPLKPRMYYLNKLQANTKQVLLFNKSLKVLYWKAPACALPSFGLRNADGDLVYFCHKGEGEIFTEYGLLPFYEGCYVVVPKSIVHSFWIKTKSEFFIIESRCGYFNFPNKALLGQTALFDLPVLKKPNLSLQQLRQKENNIKVCTIKVQKEDEITTFSYDNDIYDVVGWRGHLFPFVLDIKDIMPVMSHRVHLPPSVHSTFVTKDFIICSFVPRPLESDKDSLKVPFYHQNIDYDEVLFYHAGEFFSRDNLESSMMSLHPAGFPHGPHPQAFKEVINKKHTNEYAVMIDSHFPLKRASYLTDIELNNYWKSWGNHGGDFLVK